ncbi:MAG: Ig domain protein group 1 domain protein [Gemmatimonadetes bacterium]|nr:Ig domain protein group 1 domain protein [Gemmatimonadota bacterium]
MRIPYRSVATLVLAVGVATCSDAPTGPLRHSTAEAPSNGARGRVAFEPVFSKSALATFAQRTVFPNLNFDHVRVVIVRPVADTVKDTTIVFAPGSSDVSLDLTVDVHAETETFNTAIDYTNPTGRVFHGEGRVQAHAPNQPAPPPQPITIDYVGPGSNVTRIAVVPKVMGLIAPNGGTFGYTAFDASGAVVPTVPVAWSTSDPSIATISPTGALQPTGRRGSVTVTAVTPGNVTDNASATISLPAASMSLVSGGGQTGKVTTSLAASAVVRLVASDGLGVPGATVNFGAPTGGSVGASSVTTDGSGNAATTLKLGTVVGPQSFVASSGAFSVAIPATATAGDPAAITAVSGAGQSDTVRHALRTPLVAKVADALGNPVAGVAVSWVRTAGTGSLGATSTVTGTDGTASVSYTLGSVVGPEGVSASVSGVTSVASFPLNAIAGSPSIIAVVSGGGQTGTAGAALAAPLVVKVTDDAGNPAPGATVTWVAVGGSVASATTTSDASGNSSNSLTLGRVAGSASVSAAITGGRSVSFAATALPGTAAALIWRVQPTNSVAASTMTPAAQVSIVDVNNNVVSVGNQITVALAGGATGAVLSGTKAKASVGGIATFDDLKIDRAGTGYTLVASTAGITTTYASTAFAVTAGAAANVSVTGDNQTATAGTAVAVAPQVKIVDANNNPIAGLSVTFAPASGSGSVAPTGAVTTDAQGVAALTSWTLGTVAGAQSLVVSSTGIASVTIHATAQAGAVAAIVWRIQPTSSVAASAIAPVQMALVDANGNVVSSTNQLTVALAGGATGAVLSGTKTKAAVGGIVTFDDLKIDRAGTGYTLVASTTGITSTFSSAAFAVSAGVAATVSVTGDNQTATVNTAVAIVPSVKIVDANNNPIAGLSVTFTPATGSGTIAPASAVTTDVQGIARLTSWTLGTTTGAQSIVASSTGIGSVTIHATALAGAAAKLGITTQPAEAGTSGSALPRQPVIQVQDQFGNAAPTSAMTITATPSSGSASLNTAAVNATTGVATFSGLAVTGTGNITLDFTSSTTGVTDVVSTAIAVAQGTATTMTIVANDATTVIPTSQSIVVNATAGIPAVAAPFIKITDANGLPVSGVSVTLAATGPVPFTITPGSGSLGLIALVGTVRTAGTYTITATTNPALAGSPRTATLVVAPAPAEQLRFVSVPTTALAGANTTATVAVTDSIGNIVTGGTDPITLAVVSGPTGGTLTGGTGTVVSGTGLASFTSLLFSAAGTYTVSASSSAHPSYRSVNGTIVVGSSSSFDALLLSNAPTTLQNNSVIPDVTVQLRSGATNVQRAGVVITATAVHGSNGTSVPALLVGTNTSITATTNSAGVATFSGMRAVGTVQSFALRFADNSSSVSVSTSDVSLTAGTAYALKIGAGDGQTGAISAALPTAARAQLADTSGNDVATSGVSITFTASPGAGSVVPAAATTNANGYIDATWTLGSTEGANSLVAKATINGTERTVTFTATAADAHSMTFSATPSSSQTSGIALSPQPAIQLLDASSHAVKRSGVVITATVAPAPGVTGASFSGTATATTDGNGLATFTNLAVSGTAGLAARLTFAVTSTTANTITAITRDITLGVSSATTAEAASALAVSATVGNALSSNYPSVRVRDASSNIVPNATNTVTFSVTSGSCGVSGQPVSIDANGAATLSATTLTLPSSAGSCVIHAVASGSLTGSPFDFRVVAAPSGAVVWSGITNDDFATGTNWIGGSAPLSSSAVFIPRFMLNSPEMRSDKTVASFTMESGGSFDVGSSNTLTVAGTVDAGTVSNGTVKATGTTGTVRGTFSSVALTFGDGTNTCSYTLNGSVNVVKSTPATSGNVSISNCNVDVSTQTLTVGRNLTVTGTNGRLVMQSSSSRVTVTGSASFSGAATDLPASTLSAGTLDIGGDFTQASTVSSSAFVASGSHITTLTGAAAQTVTFANPTTSHFYDLTVTNRSTDGTAIASVVEVKNNFVLGTSGTSATFTGSRKRLIVDGTVTAFGTTDLGGLDTLEVTSNTFPNLANTTAGKAPNLTKLSGTNVTLSSSPTVSGGLAIASGASLTIGTRTLTLLDSLVVDGTLDMSSSSGQLIVGDLARFRGGSLAGHLQAGTLKVAGDFIEEGSATTSFAPTSGFLVQLNGTSGQDVRFDHDGSASSRFANLDILNTSSSGVQISTGVHVTGALEQKGTLSVGSARTLTVDGLSEFQNGATTTVTGTLDLQPVNFYNGSTTTGTGTLTVRGTCQLGSIIAGLPNSLLVGGFNMTSCTPGRLGSTLP